MDVKLIVARDGAVAQHDQVVQQHVGKYDVAFAAALEPVIAELKRIVAAVSGASDPVEVSRTLRWLGDAWFDHGRFAGASSWQAGAEAYRRAEELLRNEGAPVEQAKLDFNYANTLAQLADGTDVKLLEEAHFRYQRAAKAFRDSHLPQFAQRVEKRLALLRTQLDLSRQQEKLSQGHQRLQELRAEATSADAVAQLRIRQELGELTERLDPRSIAATLQQGLAVASALSPSQTDELAVLEAKVAALVGVLPSEPGVSHQRTLATEYDDLGRQMLERIREAAASNKISSERANELKHTLEKFMNSIPNAPDDVLTHEAKLLRMQQAEQEGADAVISRKRPPLQSGSRAACAVDLAEALQRITLGERERRMLPPQESHVAIRLFADLSQLLADLEQAGDDDTRIAALEPRIWRMALKVHHFARRYHLVVAKPDFAMLKEPASVKSLFLSGSSALFDAATKLAQRDAIELFWKARRGEAAQERWGQLLAASVAAFDIGLPDGPARMQVCYELGLALALGKACIIVRRADTVVPFDVELAPIVFSEDAGQNVRLLETSVYSALSTVNWGGRTPQLGSAGEAAIAAVEQRVEAAASRGQLGVQLRMARANIGDAVALRGTLEHIAGSLGAQGPAILLPAWMPAAPARAAPPRCFHVMPFSQSWSGHARNRVADICARHGWIYTRGDESAAQRIIPGIWQEMCQASAVVIDITGFNVNVGLELGLVHALGRPYRIVARGHGKDHLFPGVEKVQVHGYRDEAAVSGGGWLSWLTPHSRASSATHRGLDEILGPFLLRATSSEARP